MESAGAMGKAIYLITNEEANGVVALPIGKDGTLSKGSITMTGGAGSVAVDADGNPATPDALVSQSSLTIAGKVSPINSSPYVKAVLTPIIAYLCCKRRLEHA
jgi:hypothetical protein